MPAQPPIFVINLRHAVERRQRIVDLLDGMGMSARIFKAVDGRQLDSEGEAYWQASAQRAMLSPGEIGCMLSHIRLWQTMLAENLPCAVILEDDLCFAPAFPAAVRAAAKLEHVELVKLETDLSLNVRTERRSVGKVGDVQCHRLHRGAYRTGGYLIWPDAAARLLTASKGFRYALDVEMFDRRRSSFQGLMVHQLVPAVCLQAELRPSVTHDAPYLESSIQTMGKRLDTVLGLSNEDDPRLGPMLRRRLRPAKRLIARSVWGLLGQSRGPIGFAGDHPQPLTVPEPEASTTKAEVKSAAGPQLA